MLSALLAHGGEPLRPHDLWGAWDLHPAVIVGLLLALWAHARGTARAPRRDGWRWRSACFVAAVVAVAVAVISPLDALAGALASAHMVQHVLLVLVAAPLLAVSAPSAALLRGSPPAVREAAVRWRRRFRLTRRNLSPLRHPAAVWLLHVGALWFWHAAGPYGAALESEAVHVVEHVSFLVTAVLFWQLVVGSRAAGRVSNGAGVLLVFAMGMQSVFLSLLLTFARTPWYPAYRSTTAAWHLDPLADQQLAGAIMWVPAGFIYVGTALA
ncbi:MAG: cytochrome c oxidase assembly protein, partial [Acidimicrobiales bacterium]